MPDTMTKERPILFSSPMVRALLSGAKTQTRRVVKPCQGWELPPTTARWVPAVQSLGDLGHHGYWHAYCPEWAEPTMAPCPYGVPGDRLRVREARCQRRDDGRFAYNAEGNLDPSCALYRADGEEVLKDDGDGGIETLADGRAASPWVPSIHMPRWASRLTLNVTGVRVERVRDISEKDAISEGIERFADGGYYLYDHRVHATHSPIESFRTLWDSINGKRHPWASNPWVWVVEFRRA